MLSTKTLLVALTLSVVGCVSGTLTDASTGDLAALTGSFGLDSVGSARLPVVIGSQNGLNVYLSGFDLSFDGKGSYAGAERDSTGGSPPVGGNVTTTSVSGGYAVGPTAAWDKGTGSLRTGLGYGRLTATGFTIETNSIGVMYFSKRDHI